MDRIRKQVQHLHSGVNCSAIEVASFYSVPDQDAELNICPLIFGVVTGKGWQFWNGLNKKRLSTCLKHITRIQITDFPATFGLPGGHWHYVVSCCWGWTQVTFSIKLRCLKFKMMFQQLGAKKQGQLFTILHQSHLNFWVPPKAGRCKKSRFQNAQQNVSMLVTSESASAAH